MSEKSIDQLLNELNTMSAEIKAALESIPEGAIPDKQQQETIKQLLNAAKTAKDAVDRYNKSKSKMGSLNTLVLRHRKR